MNLETLTNIKQKAGGIFAGLFALMPTEKKPTIKLEIDKENKELIENLKQAKEEWNRANINYEFALEQDLVDYYSYKIKAAQTRYTYLLKKIKKAGLRVDTDNMDFLIDK
jgi:hypothetical protein